MRFASDVIVVTGGAGFIGSTVIRHLLTETEGFIVNIDKLTYAARGMTPWDKTYRIDRYRFVQADICNAQALRNLFEQFRPHYVMNLAAETHVDRSIDGPDLFIQTNVLGTFTLLQESLRYWQELGRDEQKRFRFHHISTDEVFGSPADADLFVETTPYAPNSPYAASKAASDHLVRAWRETYGLPTITTNKLEQLRAIPIS